MESKEIGGEFHCFLGVCLTLACLFPNPYSIPRGQSAEPGIICNTIDHVNSAKETF